MHFVFLFGNGISQGFDSRLSVASITERVRDRLEDGVTETLDQLSAIARPEIAGTYTSPDMVNFEHLAGPLDRIALALLALERLPREDAPPLRALHEASEGLRKLYLQVVGAVLDEIDACCLDSDADEERHASWDQLNEFAGALVDEAKRNRVTVYTLNYDSLLTSSILERSEDWVYDGFRGMVLNAPLERWKTNTLALYHLHGSIAWVDPPDGELTKWRMSDVRRDVLPQWVSGEGWRGLPAVVLSDLKASTVSRYPFALFYQQFREDLETASEVVVGGYGFGDLPVNRELVRCLTRDKDRRMHIWTREAEKSRTRFLEVCRHLESQSSGDAVREDQIVPRDTDLPDPEVLREWIQSVV